MAEFLFWVSSLGLLLPILLIALLILGPERYGTLGHALGELFRPLYRLFAAPRRPSPAPVQLSGDCHRSQRSPKIAA